MLVRLENNLHNTFADVRPHKDSKGDYFLSATQIKRAKKTLCGMKDCMCQNAQTITWGFDEIQNPAEFIFSLATFTKYDNRLYL